MNEQNLNTQNTRQRKNFIQRNPLSVKIVLIGFLILLLMIPIAMIRDLISEREMTARQAVAEVESKWSGAQQITGPYLSVSYYKEVETTGKNDKTVKEKIKNYTHYLPEVLDISGTIKTEELKRGLYEVVVYNAPLELKGKFVLPQEFRNQMSLSDSLKTEITMNIGISDLRGINKQIEMQWGGKTFIFNPGIENNDISDSGVSVSIPMSAFASNDSNVFEFKILLNLRGSESALFVPLGKTTSVELSSNCATPSFTGSFLPQFRETGESGFKSNWQILHLNRNYPQIINGDKWIHNIYQSSFGVNLLLPVQQYQKSMRSIKYAFLIIILTFVVSFFVEVIHKKHIHPFQYLLVGLALCLFYTLLIAISEHLSFTLAYALSSFMTIALLSLYLTGVLKIKKTAFIIGALMAGLYIYIFVLIQMETYALLAGSVGLFVILSIIMYYSQRINWNGKEEK